MTSRLALLDTNVLLSATDRRRDRHEAAISLLQSDPRDMAVSPQVIREYLAVATRPAQVNGLGAARSLAVDNVRRLTGSLRVLPEDEASVAELVALLATVEVSGRQVHDANIVATALAHGASTIVTSDARHFARFADLIEVEGLT